MEDIPNKDAVDLCPNASLYSDESVDDGFVENSSSNAEVEDDAFLDFDMEEMPPWIRKPLCPTTGVMGGSVRLHCRVENGKSAQIAWRKSGRLLAENKRFQLKYHDPICELRIADLKLDDAGLYECHVRNKNGGTTTAAELSVQSAPSLSFESSSITTSMDEAIILAARVDGHPFPEISVRKDGNELVENDRISLDLFHGTMKVKIAAGVPYDSGVYTFVATNAQGKVTRNVTLYVQAKPGAPSGPLKIEVDKDSVQLSWAPPKPSDCRVEPLTAYFVEKREESRSVWIRAAAVPADVTQATIGHLVASTGYLFRVVAENVVGLSEPLESGTIVRLEAVHQSQPPLPPRGPLSVKARDSGSVVLTWGAPLSDGGAPITAYNVQCKPVVDSDWCTVLAVNAPNTTATVSDLWKTCDYQFRVTARNAEGESDPLTLLEAVCTDPTRVVPSPPAGPLLVVDQTATSLSLSWREPKIEGGSPVIAYAVSVRQTAKRAWQLPLVVTAPDTSATVADLMSGAEYIARVVARNSAGDSEPLLLSEPVICKTLRALRRGSSRQI